MKGATWFLLKFLVLAGLMCILWWNCVPAYNRLLIGSLNVIINNFTNYPFEARYGGNNQNVKESIRVVNVKVKDRSKNTVLQLNGRTLHFNIVPLFSLFLAIHGVSIGKKLQNLGISVVVIYLTHVIHAWINVVRIIPRELQVYRYPLGAWFKSLSIYLFYRLISYAGIFMEQVGSMIMPFLLWTLFYYMLLWKLFPKEVMGNKQAVVDRE